MENRKDETIGVQTSGAEDDDWFWEDNDVNEPMRFASDEFGTGIFNALYMTIEKARTKQEFKKKLIDFCDEYKDKFDQLKEMAEKIKVS